MPCTTLSKTCLPRLAPLTCALGTVLLAGTASAVPLMFNNSVEPTTGFTIDGPSVETSVIRFTNVATDGSTTVDARVTATNIKDDTDFGPQGGDVVFAGDTENPGYIPNYSADASEPNDDIGFLFAGNGVDATEDGITLLFEFFDGTGALSGTFTDSVTASSLDFAVYDVDGESTQSEFFRANISDGLQSYRVDDDASRLSVTENGDVLTFSGAGANVPETSATGAAILSYVDVSSFVLDFGAIQSGGSSQNLVFTAFDGDLSLIDPSNFSEPVVVADDTTVVPLPAPVALLLFGLSGLYVVARRPSASAD